MSVKLITIWDTYVHKLSSNRTGWNLLQDLIQARTKKLAGAYEIHKFNRDAKEILTRIKVLQ